MNHRAALVVTVFSVAFATNAAAQVWPPPAPTLPLPTLTIVAGDNQQLARVNTSSGSSSVNFAPLKVQLKDPAGRPLGNQRVMFSLKCSPAPMVCNLDPNGYKLDVEVATDGSGIATLVNGYGYSLMAAYADGPVTVAAKYGLAQATFHLTVAPPVLRAVSIVSGDKQSIQRSGIEASGGIAKFAPMTVVVKNKDGTPASGVQVNFACSSYVTPGINCEIDMGSARGTTDANGRRTLNGARGWNMSGKMPIVAMGDNISPVTFDLTVLDGAPIPPPPPHDSLQNPWGTVSTMSIVSGDNQKVARTIASGGADYADFAPLTVQLKDGKRQPVANVPVVFSVKCGPKPMVCGIEIPTNSPDVQVMTDGNGVATLAKYYGHSVQASYGDGPLTVRAYYGSAAVTFHLVVGR